LAELERASLVQILKENDKSLIEENFKVSAHYFHPFHQSGAKSPSILYTYNYNNKLLILYQDGYLQKTAFSISAQKGKKSSLVFDASQQSKANVKQFKKITNLFFSNKLPSDFFRQTQFGVTSDHSYLVCGGQWDNSLLFVKLNDLSITRLFEHKDVVSCLAIEGIKISFQFHVVSIHFLT